MVLYGGLELGGTSIRVCLAVDHVTNVTTQISFPTTTPEATLNLALNFFKQHPSIVSLGIGSFGPIDINPDSPTYGYITSTPKIAWQDFNVVAFFASLKVPVMFNTDVNAAALGELRWGQHSLIHATSNLAYITIGTGIGAGVVVAGQALSGLLHPEAGHIRVTRHPADHYVGNCPFHRDCVEGLANAKAISDRCKVTPAQLHTISDQHSCWDFEAYYLAQLCYSLACIASPHVIVLGGGVLKRACLYPKTRAQFVALNQGYLRVNRLTEDKIDSYLVPSRFDSPSSTTSAGCIGVLELSRRAHDAKVPGQKTLRSSI